MPKLLGNDQSRNDSAAFRTADARTNSVPKLDFNKLKKVKDYNDWYTYS